VSGGILFVCLGNICRSPLAEAIARQELPHAGLRLPVASAGTGDWHIGEHADARARAVARAHGYSLEAHRARQVGPDDFHRYDWVLAMDRNNLAALRDLSPPSPRARSGLLLDVAGIDAGGEVPDPYFGGDEGFVEVLQLLRRAIAGLGEHLAVDGTDATHG
jgi:protein-tyrosine phosphatase